jgi:hypothetical protein
VVLDNVNLASSGRYRCEVSAEAPSFQTVSDHGDMIVVGEFGWDSIEVKIFDESIESSKNSGNLKKVLPSQLCLHFKLPQLLHLKGSAQKKYCKIESNWILIIEFFIWMQSYVHFSGTQGKYELLSEYEGERKTKKKY